MGILEFLFYTQFRTDVVPHVFAIERRGGGWLTHYVSFKGQIGSENIHRTHAQWQAFINLQKIALFFSILRAL